MKLQEGVRKQVKTPDGRRLAVDITGAPDGTAIFLMHGTPGSRSGPKPRGIVLYRLGIRLICYDRPGYGGSDRSAGRSVADAAADTESIADALNIDRFAVIGRSGGGPHALACAALLPERVTRGAVLVGLAPADAPDLDWYAGMNQSNVDEYLIADSRPQELMDNLTSRVEAMTRQQGRPPPLLDQLDPDLAESDRSVVENAGIRRLLESTYTEALRQGPYGWIDDMLALRRPWKFSVSDILVSMLLWHGADDEFSPARHTQWLAERIPGSIIEVQPGKAHFAAVEVLPKILAWLAEPAPAAAPVPTAEPS